MSEKRFAKRFIAVLVPDSVNKGDLLVALQPGLPGYVEDFNTYDNFDDLTDDEVGGHLSLDRPWAGRGGQAAAGQKEPE